MSRTKKYHFIYKTICDVTNRYYYGMHSTSNLEDGYIGSGTRLWHSINYHGRENHSIEILEYLEDRKLLKAREKELITEDMLKDPMCMNLALGGEGGIRNESNLTSFKNGSKKTRYGNSKIHLDRRNWLWKNNEEWADVYSESMRKCALGNKSFSDRKHSDESKKKISDASKKSQKGVRNSQYGTCWIYNEFENRKVKKDELDSYLKSGWIKGRKLKQ